MIRIQQLKLRPGHTAEEMTARIARTLKIRPAQIISYTVIKKSLDARKKPELYYSYVVDVSVPQEEKLLQKLHSPDIGPAKPAVYHFPGMKEKRDGKRPVIAGTGPAGLFCGYLLAIHGFCPLLLERGADADARVRDVERFWETGNLQPESNVQFGEGGAGTFSDGKLNTLIKDRDGRSQEALRIFAEHGAPDSILYESKPHIGTDILVEVVKNMRLAIEAAGGEVRFHSKVTGLREENGRIRAVEVNGGQLVSCDRVVLAIGHSARDTFSMLYDHGLAMEPKAFAVGYRVEHPQTLINKAQYALEKPEFLPPAPYKLTAKASGGRGVYSFCMCPGGYVVNASSEKGRLAVNGMSYSGRESRHANSAIIVSVTPEDYRRPLEPLQMEDIPEALSGIAFQRALEERAYRAGQGKIPVQRLADFGRITETARTVNTGDPCMKGAYRYADVESILPQELNQAFLEGMRQFGRIIPGFDAGDTLVSGVESRTSSPVRILRNERLQSLSLEGLYPCGEGAGYAGGIMSAAMDGMRVAEQIAAQIAEQHAEKI